MMKLIHQLQKSCVVDDFTLICWTNGKWEMKSYRYKEMNNLRSKATYEGNLICNIPFSRLRINWAAIHIHFIWLLFTSLTWDTREVHRYFQSIIECICVRNAFQWNDFNKNKPMSRTLNLFMTFDKLDPLTKRTEISIDLFFVISDAELIRSYLENVLSWYTV